MNSLMHRVRHSSIVVLFMVFVQLTSWTTTAAWSTPAPLDTTVWTISFELAFGDGSPYTTTFPNLYKLPYNTSYSITREVLDHVVGIALAQTKTKRLGLMYGPGAYKDYPVQPSAHLQVRTSQANLLDIMNIIGFLAQQTEVIAMRPSLVGTRPTVQVVQTRGNFLASPVGVHHFWESLRAISPELQGFAPVRIQGAPGMRMIDFDTSWSVSQVMNFDNVLESVCRRYRIPVQVRRFMVDFQNVKNDWNVANTGESYLAELRTHGKSELANKLVTVYAPTVQSRLRKAFKRLRTQDSGKWRSVFNSR